MVCLRIKITGVMNIGAWAGMSILLSVIRVLVGEVIRHMRLLVELAETEGGAIEIALDLLEQLFLDEPWVSQR